MPGRGYKRRKYLVDRSYQGKYVLGVAAICAAGLALALGLMGFLSYQRLWAEAWLVHPVEATAGEMIEPYLLYSGLSALAVTVPALAIFLRFAMQKAARPIFRLSRYIEQVGHGNLTLNLDWFMNDEFRSTAMELNLMTSGLRARYSPLRDAASRIGRLADAAVHAGPGVREMDGLVEQIDRLEAALKARGHH